MEDADAAVAAFFATGQWPPAPMPRTAITSWSRKSRADMVRRLCELDYAPLHEGGHAVRMVQVSPEDGISAGRIARRRARAQNRSQSRWVQRIDHTTGRFRYHRGPTRVRVVTNGNPAGSLSTTARGS